MKSKLLIVVLLISAILNLFVGCQTLQPPKQTEPSAPTVPTDPAETELAITIENIKTYITEGITYAEVKTLFGPNDDDLSYNPINKPSRIWYLEGEGNNGAYLQVDFSHPEEPHYRFADWCESLNLSTKLIPGSADYIHYLSIWLENQNATNAMIRKDGQTLEVIFGEDYYTPQPTEPTETICPRTIDYFKSHLMPYMTYREAIAILGAKDAENSSDSYNWKEAIWYLENDYILLVDFFPTANSNMYEYLSTEPTGETNPDGTSVDDFHYLMEWSMHMEAYRAILYRSTLSLENQVKVWFDYGYGPFWQEEE